MTTLSAVTLTLPLTSNSKAQDYASTANPRSQAIFLSAFQVLCADDNIDNATITGTNPVSLTHLVCKIVEVVAAYKTSGLNLTSSTGDGEYKLQAASALCNLILDWLHNKCTISDGLGHQLIALASPLISDARYQLLKGWVADVDCGLKAMIAGMILGSKNASAFQTTAIEAGECCAGTLFSCFRV